MKKSQAAVLDAIDRKLLLGYYALFCCEKLVNLYLLLIKVASSAFP